MTKQDVLDSLRTWINQRPGLEFGNYGDYKAYRAEMRSITKDLHHARQLLRAVELRDSISLEDVLAGFRAYSGRLQIKEENGKPRLEYCTGQYWPTEYRKAACAVLSSILWAWTRDHCMPSKIVKDGRDYYPHVNGSSNQQSAGDWLRSHFRREYGPSIANRWFN